MQVRPSKSGLAVCAGLALLGLMVWGGFEATRQSMDHSPATGVTPGISGRPVSIIACDVNLDHTVVDRLVAELAREKPDFVLLQRVDQADLNRLCAAMGIGPGGFGGRDATERSVFDISVNAEPSDGTWGNAILSTGPLYEARAIPNEGGGSIGVWAVSAMDARRFRVASVDLVDSTGPDVGRSQELEVDHFREAWRAAGDEPMILGMRKANRNPIENGRKSGEQIVSDEMFEISTPWNMTGSVKEIAGAGSCFGVEVGP